MQTTDGGAEIEPPIFPCLRSFRSIEEETCIALCLIVVIRLIKITKTPGRWTCLKGQERREHVFSVFLVD